MPTDTLALDAFAALTTDDIATIDFSRLVGLLNEPNMPSGGGATIRRVIDLARLRPGSRVLEVGSNTGYTSIEFASWIDGHVTGLDINPVSTAFAREKAARHGLRNLTFDVGDGQDLPYADGSFDLVYVSNVTSFIDDHRRACDEYHRVLADDGLLVAAPIYYRTPPPEDMRRRVGAAIGVDLKVTDQRYWTDMFADPRATLVEQETYEYLRQSDERIAAYVGTVLDQPHLHRIDPALRAAAADRLTYFYRLFDENLSYARYDILVFRRGHPNPEPVLHTSRRVVGDR
ncbi:class I SAM-dependent methyltransferase [Actinoplanes sp. N902-109]|uniref:class I SAM-dependent methyltransferase n=1 Tax=Actinoplanes sp. (strain N902-109) TaxID=649831 RepID=UPI0003294053|nr:class I SAM-dependent methyltransferase [Actinoplanes sp. N902-109]AGL19164.1 SAM-dependent methyltransferase [Actinoplanes sp. N902-109]